MSPKHIVALGKMINAVATVAPGVADRGAYASFRNLRPRGKVTERERAVHERAQTGSVEVNGKRVVTYQWGSDGRPILLVHGWQSRASRFAAFIDALTDRGYRPIGFDAPGNGDSQGRQTTILEYESAIRQLSARYGPFDGMICHSFGALAALHSVRKLPETPKIVTIGGVSEFNYLHEKFCSELRLDARVSARLRHRVGTGLFADINDVWSHFDSTRDTHEIGGSLLLIHSTDDARTSVAQTHRLAAAIPDRAQLHLVEGLGHHRILSDPVVVRRSVEFLTSAADVETARLAG